MRDVTLDGRFRIRVRGGGDRSSSVPAMPRGDTERGERLARIGLVVAMALSALTILLLGRHLTFWSDELDWLTFGNDFDPRDLLTPHGSHLMRDQPGDLRGPAAHLRDRLPAVQDRRGRLPAGMCGARLRPRQAPDGRARRPRAGGRPALLRLGPGHDAVAARDPLHALDRIRARGLPGGRARRPEGRRRRDRPAHPRRPLAHLRHDHRRRRRRLPARRAGLAQAHLGRGGADRPLDRLVAVGAAVPPVDRRRLGRARGAAVHPQGGRSGDRGQLRDPPEPGRQARPAGARAARRLRPRRRRRRRRPRRPDPANQGHPLALGISGDDPRVLGRRRPRRGHRAGRRRRRATCSSGRSCWS